MEDTAVNTEVVVNEGEHGRFARGIFWGVLISLPIWVVIWVFVR
jgi:hypothetical protein